ncbi:hypothetical protein Bca4012_061329 [Brassica carinata]
MDNIYFCPTDLKLGHATKRISHEEGTCPELNDEQRERNRLSRVEKKEKEQVANREAFSVPQNRIGGDPRPPRLERSRGLSQKDEGRLPQPRSPWREGSRENTDLRHSITEKRAMQPKKVWDRIDTDKTEHYPRNRERYHPYQQRREYPSNRTGRQQPLQEWRNRSSSDSRELSLRRPESGSVSRRNGSPHDSQRTVSDNFAYARYGDRYRGREEERRHQRLHQKYYQEGKEWRPVRSLETSKEQTPEQGALSETEEEKRRRIKGKAHVTDGAAPPMPMIERSIERSLERSLNAPLRITEREKGGTTSIQKESNQETRHHQDKEVEKFPQIEEPNKSLQDTVREQKKGEEDDDISMEEGDFNKMVDYYNEIGMTDEMIDNDDLLDDIVVPETQMMAVEKGREQIEAIAQLEEKSIKGGTSN